MSDDGEMPQSSPDESRQITSLAVGCTPPEVVPVVIVEAKSDFSGIATSIAESVNAVEAAQVTIIESKSAQSHMSNSLSPMEVTPDHMTVIEPKSESLDIDTDKEGIIAQSSVVASSTGTPTLQSLLAAPVSNGHIQIITVSSPSELITTTQPDGGGKVWQVVPSATNPEIATIIAVNNADFENKSELNENTDQLVGQDSSDSTISTGTSAISSIMAPPPVPTNCPAWAARLKNCQMIGNSYRGYVESEVELDLLLTYHKQQTQSFWGTRQSPSPAKPSTRLMWKSQYVPFDGIPFINSGSRAIVMECQYGPRRKGNLNKKQPESLTKMPEYRQTCPARIYIKKVRKFPEYTVDINLDKKSLKATMDKAFQELKTREMENLGQERHYVQLPTEAAHEFHNDGSTLQPTMNYEQEMDPLVSRLHLKVAEKIREMVAGGESRIYVIRKQLRNFVTKELFHGTDMSLERHDLTLFPTVNDLKNHIHQALKDIETGVLPLTASTVNVEIISSSDTNNSHDANPELQTVSQSLWQQLTPTGVDGPIPETVTVTLTQNPDEDGHHEISRIETHLSDGTTQVSTTLSPETAQLLSKLHPGLISPDSYIQLQSLQSQLPGLQPETNSPASQIVSTNSHHQEDNSEDNHKSEDMETEMSHQYEGVTTLQIVSTHGSQFLQNGAHIVQSATDSHLMSGAQILQAGEAAIVNAENGQLISSGTTTHVVTTEGPATIHSADVNAENGQLLPTGATAQIVATEAGSFHSPGLITIKMNTESGELFQIEENGKV